MTPSKIFLYFCLSFVGGIFLSSLFQISQLLMLTFLILGVLLISVLWRHPAGSRPQIEGGTNGAGKRPAVIGFCLLFLVLGGWRYQIAESEGRNSILRAYSESKETVTLLGTMAAEPDVGEKSTKLIVNVEQLIKEGREFKIQEKILITTRKYPEYKYGDKLKIIGNLKSPPIFEGFNYKDYLKKDGIFAIMEWPEIELVSSGFGSPIIQTLFSFKHELKESLNNAMSPPQSGLLEALFFGDEENISQEWKEKFNLTGTRHITAVSGMNITIISALLLSFFLALGFWRNQALFSSIIIIALYILMIGAPASAIRAGIMAILFLSAQYFGRMSLASRAIVFAAALMLAQNPLLLRLDAGFQLSFLAMMGLIYVQPTVSGWLRNIPNILQLKTSLSATISAQIFTLPILIYNFGRIPIAAPIVNVLVVPLLPIITILGFIFSFLGIFWQGLGQILSWPAWLLLTYLIKIIDFFSQMTWVSFSLENIHWLWLVFLYLILSCFVWRWQEKQKLKFLNY